MKWVKGHNGHARNEGADIQADIGAKKAVHDEVPLDVPPALKITGAKLSALTQSLAYKAIREQKMKAKLKKRDRTVVNLEKTKTMHSGSSRPRPKYGSRCDARTFQDKCATSCGKQCMMHTSWARTGSGNQIVLRRRSGANASTVEKWTQWNTY
jgi:hypothetical protein